MVSKTHLESEVRSVIGRRGFIVALTAGSIAGAGPSRAATGTATVQDLDRTIARYRKSQHVKTFYRVNRYP
jgi:hypothetical protein